MQTTGAARNSPSAGSQERLTMELCRCVVEQSLSVAVEVGIILLHRVRLDVSRRTFGRQMRSRRCVQWLRKLPTGRKHKSAKSMCSKHTSELFRLVMDGTVSGKLDEGLLDRRRVLELMVVYGGFALATHQWRTASHAGRDVRSIEGVLLVSGVAGVALEALKMSRW
jgi:hypothetical protein